LAYDASSSSGSMPGAGSGADGQHFGVILAFHCSLIAKQR
jgi:hypothetical protein